MTAPAIAIGVKVRITAGAAVGKEGIVFAPWPRYWERGVPLWIIRSDDLVRQRIIRADYLQVCP